MSLFLGAKVADWTLQNPQSNMLREIDPTFSPPVAARNSLLSHGEVKAKMNAPGGATQTPAGRDPLALAAQKKAVPGNMNSTAVSRAVPTRTHAGAPSQDQTQTGIVPKVGGGTTVAQPGMEPTSIKQGPQALGGAGATRVGPAPMNIKAPAGKPVPRINTPGPGMAQRASQMGRQALQLGQKAWANPWARGAALVGGGLAAGGLAGHLMTGNGDERR